MPNPGCKENVLPSLDLHWPQSCQVLDRRHTQRGGAVTLGGVLAAVRVRWLVVLLATMVGALGATTMALTAPKTYVATSTVLLRWVGPQSGEAEPSSMRYISSRAQTYALLSERPAVLEHAAELSGLNISVAELRASLEAEAPSGAQLIRIAAWSGNPQRAAVIANAAAEAVSIGVIREEVVSALNPGNIDAVVAVEAVVPRVAATPRIVMYVAVGTTLGFVLGLGAALMLTYLSMRRHPRNVHLESPTPPPAGRRVTTAHVVWVMLIAATIPWRNDTFYEGGADPVVLAKAAISLMALALSAWVFHRTPHRHPVPAAPVLMLSAYLAVTVIGALANEDLPAGLVVAVRVAILIVSLCLVAAAFGPMHLMRSLVHVLGVLVILSTMSGLAYFSGRLGGVLPPLKPNALAFVTAVVCIWLLAKVLAGRDATWELFAIGGCLVVVILTGSRTGLAAMVIAFVAMCFRMTALRKRTFLLIALCLPGIAYLVMGTDVLSSVLLRGGGQQVATLSNRTIAWEAALNLDRDVWQTWFGQGLAQKKISVPGQYWDTQLLDSSWISALVQGGNLGVSLVVLVGVATLAYAAFSSRAKGATWLGLAVLTTLGGFLESGLFDGSIQFMVFVVTALGAFGSHVQTIGVDRRAVTAAAPRVARQKVLLS